MYFSPDNKYLICGAGLIDWQNKEVKECLLPDYMGVDVEQVLAKVFQERGSAFYGKDSVFVTTLTDAEVTREKLEAEIGAIAQKAQPQDVFIFSMAGHGATVGQLYYFFPYNFPFTESQLNTDSVIRRNGIGGDEINDWLNNVPAMKRVLIYDTCQSSAAISRNAMEERKAMELLSRMTGSFMIAAASGFQKAQELPEMGHGVLTYALLGGLGAAEKGLLQKRSAVSSDGMVHVRDWLIFAQDCVGELSRLTYGEEQQAVFLAGENNFPVLKP